MDRLKMFTQVLPLLLTKLEIIRQVLEAHGLGEWGSCDFSESSDRIGFHWSLRHSDYSLDVELSTMQSWRFVYLSLTHDHGGCLWISLNDDGTWMLWRDSLWESNNDIELSEQGLIVLNNLQKLDIQCRIGSVNTEDTDVLSAESAREVMGMMATFFAKLPEDPSKTAG